MELTGQGLAEAEGAPLGLEGGEAPPAASSSAINDASADSPALLMAHAAAPAHSLGTATVSTLALC